MTHNTPRTAQTKSRFRSFAGLGCLASLALSLAACSSTTPPITMPQYQVDRSKFEPSPPAPTTAAGQGVGTVASGVTVDPVKIEPDKATGYSNLPTTATQLFDGPVRPLSLPDVVVETLANDRQIKVQGYTLRIAEFQVPVSKSIYDLVMGASASYTRVEDQGLPGSFPNVNSSRSRAIQGTLSQLFPSGAMVGLALQTARNTNLIGFSGPTGDLSASNLLSYPNRAAFNITQPLLKGFGSDITNAGIRIAQEAQQGAAADFQVQVESRLLNSLLTYWDLIGAIENYKVEVISFSAAQDLLRVNRAKYEAGMLPYPDVLTAEAAVESRRNLIIQARQRVRDLEDLLKRQIFLKEGSPLWETQIQPSQAISYRPLLVDLDQTIKVALDNRAELRRTQSNINQAKESLKVADNNRLPSLNAFGSVNTNGVGDGFDRGIDNEVSGRFMGYSAGLEFSFPLQNRAARYQYGQAQARVSQADELHRDESDQVTLEVRQAVRGLRTAMEQIEATQASVRSEQANLDAQTHRYEVGLSTLYDVLLFQNDLATAQSAHIAAVVAYNQANVRLERAKGSILGTYGVQVSGANLNPPNPPIKFAEVIKP